MHKDVMNPLRIIYLVMFILLVGLLIPAVSAYDYVEHYDIDYYGWANQLNAPYSDMNHPGGNNYDTIEVRNVKSLQDVTMLKVQFEKGKCIIPENSQTFPIVLKIGDNIIGHGTYGTFQTTTRDVVWVTIDDIDVSGYSGTQRIKFQKIESDNQVFAHGRGGTTIGKSGWTKYYHTYGSNRFNWDTSVQWSERGHEWNFYVYIDSYFVAYADCKPEVYYHRTWAVDFTLDKSIGDQYEFNINRDNGAVLIIYDGDNNPIIEETSIKYTPELIYLTNPPFTIAVSPDLGNWFNKTYYQDITEPGEPGEPEEGVNKTFSVFIKDGNTYEPINEAEMAFKRYDTGQWVLNKTIYNGSGTITLPKGEYYAYVNTTGYYQPTPMHILVDDNLVSATFNIYRIGDIPEPEEPTEFLDLTVSVKNSQTGALIGGSEIGIQRYGDTGFYQNLTLSSGYTTVFLPPGIYEIFAEAPGYYQVYPATITLDEPHENIGVFLQPITPIPEEGNVTLNLWVCYVEHGSGQAVGIPYADILISGISGDGIGYSSGSLITDMGGYLTLDIPANTEYIAYAEKPGYLAGTTHFTVFNVSPVNMTIQMIREIPPTVPVVTPSPTMPTLPTPTEPLGFMEQSGKALGDLFGVSLSIGKMMLGVLISLAVGMGTAKNLKGGAPEFCVGFLGAAFLVTMADLIPVGFFVAMLLLMGIYIARAYFLGGENGG